MDLREDSNVDIVDTLFMRKASYLIFEVAIRKGTELTVLPKPKYDSHTTCHGHTVWVTRKQ